MTKINYKKILTDKSHIKVEEVPPEMMNTVTVTLLEALNAMEEAVKEYSLISPIITINI